MQDKTRPPSLKHSTNQSRNIPTHRVKCRRRAGNKCSSAGGLHVCKHNKILREGIILDQNTPNSKAILPEGNLITHMAISKVRYNLSPLESAQGCFASGRMRATCHKNGFCTPVEQISLNRDLNGCRRQTSTQTREVLDGG